MGRRLSSQQLNSIHLGNEVRNLKKELKELKVELELEKEKFQVLETKILEFINTYNLSKSTYPC